MLVAVVFQTGYVGSALAQGVASPGVAAAQNQHLQLNHLLQSIDPYLPHADLKGQAVISGSTTMNELGKNWADRFRLFHPGVAFTRGVDGSDAALNLLRKTPKSS